MANQWYIRRGTKISSPRDSAQLKSDVAKGLVKREDHISKSPTGPWTVAQKVKGLFPPQEASAIRDGPAVQESSSNQTSKIINNNHPDSGLDQIQSVEQVNSKGLHAHFLIFLLLVTFCGAFWFVTGSAFQNNSAAVDMRITATTKVAILKEKCSKAFDAYEAVSKVIGTHAVTAEEYKAEHLMLDEKRKAWTDIGEEMDEPLKNLAKAETAESHASKVQNELIPWGIGAGIVADVLLLIVVLALQKIKFKT